MYRRIFNSYFVSATRFVFLLVVGGLPVSFSPVTVYSQVDAESAPKIDALVQKTLDIAGDNRPELQRAIEQIETEFQPGMNFLLAYMPPTDARKLSTDFLLEHVRGAYFAWHHSPWHDQIPIEIFLNDVLPYANVSEKRESWRADFRKRFLPRVKNAQTLSEAAVILNQEIFKDVGVKYSTERRRADQGPYESIESGTASCTGLSILLIDACRAVAIPARFVGTPRWSDNSGNHSWVEIWDGEWKYTGAAEPTGDALNQGWFAERAATAQSDKPMYAIYAVSYRKTGLKFPLVWQRHFDPVWSVNVTDRYTASSTKLGEDQVLVRIKVIDPITKQRVPATIVIKDSQGVEVFSGQSNDESADANDHLNAPLVKNSAYSIHYNFKELQSTKKIETADEALLVTLTLISTEDIEPPISKFKSLNKKDTELEADRLWDQRKKELAIERTDELKNTLIKLEKYPDLEMKYEFRTFGEKPAAGHALFISMHGGGGAPARVNEQQWKNQIGLYQPAEGIYLAPRAPTNDWNLWHQQHIDDFFDRIIEDFVVSGLVDPNRVFIMGYSAGGDGVYQLAPRMADRFAAAAMMAGHPNETQPLGLRNIPFAIYMGGNDAAYDRNKIAGQWKEKLNELRDADSDGYEHLVTIYPDKGHWMDREDASALAWMTQHKRNVWPKKVVWHQDDVTHDRYYWLSVPEKTAKERTTMTATVVGQTIEVETRDVEKFRIWLSDELLNLDDEIELVVNGKSQTFNVTRTSESLRLSLESRNDRQMMASAYIDAVTK